MDLIDLMATFVDASSVPYPDTFRDTQIQPPEGVSLLPALAGGRLQRTAPLCFEHHGNKAIRDGRWKLVCGYRRDQPDRWELYDMDADRTESRDLSARHPMKKQALLDAWQAWATRVGVQPWPIKRPDRDG